MHVPRRIAYDPSVAEVEYAVKNGVARITINRPERRNAMSFEVMRLITETLEHAATDESVHVVVLTGAGERAFSAGADLTAMGADTPAVGAHNAPSMPANMFLWV